MSFLRGPILVLNGLIIAYYVALNAFYLILLITGIRGAWITRRRSRLRVEEFLMDTPVTPPITVLVPAYNEGVAVAESVRAQLGVRYPGLEVIVINDGSTDSTLSELIHSFSLRRADVVFNPLIPTAKVRGIYLSTLEPRLIVIDKENGGKSDAQNAGLNLCRTPWVCIVDADSLVEEDALLRAIRPAVLDETVVATGGIIRIINGCRVAGGRILSVGLPLQPIVIFQVVEYLRSFLIGRLGWSWINGLLIISGAFGLFRADVLREVGGYSAGSMAEDMDVVVRIHRHFRTEGKPYRVMFVPDAACWTEGPAQAGALGRQRRRWQRGLAEVLAAYKNMFFQPRMGLVGFLSLPYFALELVSPLLETVGILMVPAAYLLGWVSGGYVAFYLTLSLLLGALFGVWAVAIEEITFRRYTSLRDVFLLLLFALVQNIGYYQLLLWHRFAGLVDYARGRRVWGEQVRVGFKRSKAQR